ncbi:hypothetical protein AVEN_221733-1 [Araneus ventricosus]|uniref:ribonuclease H n=1 Tax=Araneus ventricosus TaxID=182803 RepID=A0A4Y2IVW8_ARAVE|nr:hypothetical protein AVEN_193707-1 [Araneus ventricosus]GBM81999.1 hypothetical protein AVEN_42172-1 [Araneus ventricosus]GBM82008.1 hypothetical protein AVEN_80355-1 [Araneus ventricosus]GBM82048.1 hypothetical protein AVEN_221733-1 [Araneus ventricosus]
MTEDHHIFTDGSKIGNRVGAAFVHYANKQEITKSQYRLTDHNTVYMAEVVAIHKATDYILDHELNDVKIVSDSRSALMTVESLSDNREFIWQIKKMLKDREDIKLMWVRAHKGEMGNERADLLAKEAFNRDLIDVQFTYTKVQIRNINNKKKSLFGKLEGKGRFLYVNVTKVMKYYILINTDIANDFIVSTHCNIYAVILIS